MNVAILTGRLTRDPETRATGSGATVTNFTVAVDRAYSKEKEADFIDIVAFGTTADFVAKYFNKGQKIEIEGRIQTRTYEKDGQKRKVFEVVANGVGFGESKKASEDNTASPVTVPEPEQTDIDYFTPVDIDDLPF